jgi:hypothetical protein
MARRLFDKGSPVFCVKVSPVFGAYIAVSLMVGLANPREGVDV